VSLRGDVVLDAKFGENFAGRAGAAFDYVFEAHTQVVVSVDVGNRRRPV